MIQSQVDPRNGSGALLPFLRSGADACSDLHIADWFDLCRELKRHGLLSATADELASKSPSPVARKLAAYTKGHRQLMAKRLHALNSFADEAERQSLHFVVIKGMALSSVLYGDAFARQICRKGFDPSEGPCSLFGCVLAVVVSSSIDGENRDAAIYSSLV